jgi:lipopolysaccharide export system protein LptA
MNMMKRLFAVILFCAPVLLAAQVQEDTVSSSEKKRIRILNSDNTKTIQSDTGEISRFRGNVNIEHNGVIMFCDSAIMFNSIFEAFGHTKVVNGTTIVTGDVMTYSNITSKADVRGRIVYLTDGSSTLRTTRVDFNTETEIGYFENEGTIVDSFRTLESKKGYYYSKIKEFDFIGQVQSDTKDYVLQSDSMKYNTDTKLFTFYLNTHIWSDNGYLYCDKGWYDSDKDIMFFYKNSYMLTSKQEIFADSIYYENLNKKGRLYSNIQVTDTSQRTIALADFADFDMNTEDFLMRKNPAVIMYDDKDSTFLRADTLYSITRHLKIPIVNPTDSIPIISPSLDSIPVNFSVTDSIPLDFSVTDSIPVNSSVTDSISLDSSATDSIPVNSSVTDSIPLVDSLITDSIPINISVTDSIPVNSSVTDSISPDLSTDSIPVNSSVTDSISPDLSTDYIDSTQYIDSTYKELFAFKHVKMYRSDFQVKCDSMYFNNLDSIWKMFYEPILWDGKKMQITSDSMKFFMIHGDLEHADFNGNAMIVTPEGDPDSTRYFNQIKSKNMQAHLTDRKLNVFEAVGNVQTIGFSLAELTINKAEALSLKMTFDAGKIRRMTYYSDVTATNNPLFLVTEDDTKLPGYHWSIDLRPKSGTEVLNRFLHPSERAAREILPKPTFPITERIDNIELGIKN